MRYILFLFILLFTLKGFSISRIEGRIDGYYNERIELLKNRDHLSKLKALLDADTITSSGYFSFSIDNQSSFTGYLRIADRVLPIHIQPNATIFLQLKCPQNLEDLLTPIAFDSVGVSNVKFDEWKYKNAFLANFNQFLEKNQTRIFYHKADSVKKQFVDSIYTSNPLLFEQSGYINNFVNFTLAGLEIVLGTPDQVIFDSLIQSSQLLYTSDAYSSFVLQFFNERTNQLFNSAYRSKQSQLQQSPFEVINTIFGQDSLISKNERLKEYLILGFALDHVKTSMVPTETWLRLMYQIAQNSAYEEHRLIAQNVIQKLDILEQKELAPPFQLPQENGKKYDLKDANGKFVYIQFWADWSMESTRHMKVLERIHKENGRNVQVIRR